MPIVVGSYLFATFNSGSAYYDPALYRQVIGALLIILLHDQIFILLLLRFVSLCMLWLRTIGL
jgi:hypothetical protein